MTYHPELGIAIQHHRSGRLIEAERIYRQILSIDAGHADSLHLLGMIAHSRGSLESAAAMIRQAISIDPSESIYYSNLGNVLREQGQLDDATANYRQAVALTPDSAEALNNLGIALAAQGERAEAMELYRRALTINPACAEGLSNLGQVLQEQGRVDEALTAYAQALALKPDFTEAHYNLGNALQGKDDFDAAADSYQRALALKPDFPEAHCNLANTLRAQDKIEAALASYERALKLKPDFALARYGRALSWLAQGNFTDGWSAYEWRWQTSHQQPLRAYSQPVWNGEPLTSGRLLLWHEQGVGDEIMFAGLIPDVLRGGTRCILDCEPRLRPLFSRSFPDVQVVTGLEAANLDFTAHLPLGSLPRLLRKTIADFAATTSPYLLADPAQTQHFRTRYSNGKRLIGLAWHTTNKDTGRRRSIDLSLFVPLFELPGISWISLQYGDNADALSSPILIDRSVDQLSDMDAFAAQISALDLVITIDNSTAHLAGALGVPVWLLLPFAPDWRWLRGREDSLWYPSMRLFRQATPGDWPAVIQRVRELL